MVVYPDKIAQGWDSSLIYLPYLNQRKNVINYLDSMNIDKSSVGSFFPNNSNEKYISLDVDTVSFAEFDIKTNKYIIISSVFNDIPDKLLGDVESFYEIKNFDQLRLKMRIYKVND